MSKIKGFIISLILLLFIGLAVYLVITTDIIKITKINVNEFDKVTRTEIEYYSGIYNGQYYFEVDTFAAEEGLLKHPFIRDAVVEKIFPNTVNISIDYRKHLFSIVNVDLILSLDEDLVVLEVLPDVGDNYVVSGFTFDSFSAGSTIGVDRIYILRNISSLIKLFEKEAISPNKNISFQKNSIIFEIEGIKINFGTGENLESKFYNALSIYYDLKQEATSFGTIDVSSSGLPVFRPFGD